MSGHHTSRMTASSAQICREFGWRRGTILRSNAYEAAPPQVIQLTAIGDREILAKGLIADGGSIDFEREAVWDLTIRDWEVA